MASATKEYKFPVNNLFTSSRTHQLFSSPLNVIRSVSLESDESQYVVPVTEPPSAGQRVLKGDKATLQKSEIPFRTQDKTYITELGKNMHSNKNAGKILEPRVTFSVGSA